MNKITLYAILLLMTLPLCVRADELARRASWEAKFDPVTHVPGVRIKSLEKNSPLAKAGLKKGDRIIRVNNTLISTGEVFYDLTDALVAKTRYTITYQSDGHTQKTTTQFKALDKESYASHDTLYEQITSDYGIKQRVIITKPRSISTPLPAVFVIQGLSCSSIEQTPGRTSSFMHLLTDMIKKTEIVMLRVEKPGLGDSEGNCSATDFKTELNGYETALKWLKSKNYVDHTKIIVYGSSMGSALAPYIANKYELSGIISDGTYMKTWYEHMLEIERRILRMKGFSQAEITRKMISSYIPLYHGMLIEKRSYADILQQYPAIAEDNYHAPNHMYGRPMSFYHQLQDFDIPGQWEQVKVPVRIRWGTNDWIMSEADNDQIIEILNANNHTNHKLFKQQGMDHWEAIHPDMLSSFQGKKGQWDDTISQVIVDWINELTQ